MSYDISYRRRAFVMTAAQAGHYDDVLFLVEEAGSNNCYEIGNRRRSRDWSCLATGARWECLSEVTRCAASCCGGSLVLYGHRDTAPETYIRTWRKTMAAAVPFGNAFHAGFHLQIFTRIPDATAQGDCRHAFERLNAQTVVAPRRGKNEWNGTEYTEWCFSAAMPVQVKLWLETRDGGRGFKSVEVSGPD